MKPLYPDEETNEPNEILEIIIGLIDDYFKGYLDIDQLTILLVNL